MSTPRYSSVEDFLTSVGTPKGQTIKAILDFILAEFPGLELKMAWNVPHIHRDGKYIVGISAAKNHLTFSPWSAQVLEEFKGEGRLEGYVVFKNCFQIPVDWDIDRDLVKDLVQARLAELN